jgi:hypothetical protein
MQDPSCRDPLPGHAAEQFPFVGTQKCHLQAIDL